MNRILGMSATAVLLAAVAVRAGVAAAVTGAASTRSYKRDSRARAGGHPIISE
jgi:hypothetical protein